MKCCEKITPSEKVGVLCKKNGTYDIIEYSELTEEEANRAIINENGETKLYFELGSILIFMLKSEKLLKIC